MRIQDMDMYQSYQDVAAPGMVHQVDRYLPTTLECYRPSKYGILDLNAPDMASAFPEVQLQSPDSVYRVVYGLNLVSWTPPSVFTTAHIDPITFDQQHHEEDQDHHH